MFWKVTLPSTLIFPAKQDDCTINLAVSFYLYLNLKPLEKCFFFRQWVTGVRDRDIIFRDETGLVFCFLGCVVKFLAHEANSCMAEKGEFESWQWSLCLFFFLFFFPSYCFSIFHDQTNTPTQTRIVRGPPCGKAERRQRTQFASLDFWISDLKCLTWGIHLV